MKPRRCFLFVAVMIGLTVCFMTGIWAIDISISAQLNKGITVNILGAQDPFFTYHLGLLICICSFTTMALVAAYGVTKK